MFASTVQVKVMCVHPPSPRLLLTDVVRDKETAAVKEPKEAEEEAEGVCVYVCVYVCVRVCVCTCGHFEMCSILFRS